MEIKSVRLSGVLKKEDTGIVFDARWLRFKTSCLFKKSRRKLMKSRRVFRKRQAAISMLNILLIKHVVEHIY